MATLLSLGAHLGFLHSTMTCSALDGRGASRKWEISLLEWAAAAGLVGAEAAGMLAALHSFQSRAAWLGNSSGKAQFCSRLVTLVCNGHRDRPCRLRPGIIRPVLLIPEFLRVLGL